MGLLDFNISEFASRIVRGGGVRGRIRPTLDDGMVVAVRVGDWTQAPYRTDEKRFFGCISQTPTLAANFSTVAIENNSQLPVIIESIEYTQRAGVVLAIDELLLDRTLVLGNNSVFVTGEGSRSTPAGAGAGIVQLPLVVLSTNFLPALLGGGPVVRRHTLNANTVPTLDRIEGYDMMVPPGCSYACQALTASTAFSVTFRLRAPQQFILPS